MQRSGRAKQHTLEPLGALRRLLAPRVGQFVAETEAFFAAPELPAASPTIGRDMSSRLAVAQIRSAADAGSMRLLISRAEVPSHRPGGFSLPLLFVELELGLHPRAQCNLRIIRRRRSFC
jgi:hypothetical protein